MYVLSTSRQFGKTTWIIKEASRSDGQIIVSSALEAMEVMRIAEKLGLKIRYPMAIHDVLSQHGNGGLIRRLGGLRVPLYFDNAENILQSLFPSYEVLGMTCTIGNSESAKSAEDYESKKDKPMSGCVIDSAVCPVCLTQSCIHSISVETKEKLEKIGYILQRVQVPSDQIENKSENKSEVLECPDNADAYGIDSNASVECTECTHPEHARYVAQDGKQGCYKCSQILD